MWLTALRGGALAELIDLHAEAKVWIDCTSIEGTHGMRRRQIALNEARQNWAPRGSPLGIF